MAQTERRVAAWKAQPLKGLIYVIASIVVAIIYLKALAPAIGLSFLDATMNYGFLFFFWGFALLALFECWPFANLGQPWVGLATTALSWILTVFTWNWLLARMGLYDAFAFISYVMFFLTMISWFYDNAPGAGMTQPLKGIFLLLLSVVLGWVVYTQIGCIDQMWLYFVPAFLLPAFDNWPIAEYNPYVRGTFWAVVILIATWVTNELLNLAGMPVASPRGTDFVSLTFGAMIFIYSFEHWPFQQVKQPLRGILLIVVTAIITVVLSILAWSVFGVEDFWVSGWSFAVWIWLMVIQWLLYPWPF